MKLSVEGYKSITSKQDILFPGLTILAGSNSSGKSSFMQPFLILKQTIENHYDTGSLLLDGENIKLTDASQIFPKIPGKNKKSFSIYIAEEEMICEIRYIYKRNAGIVADSVYLEDKEKYQNGLTLRIGMKSEEISRQIPDNEFKRFKEFMSDQGFDSKWKTVRNKCFIHAELGAANARRPLPINVAMYPAGKLEDIVTKLIHVPGLRGNPERTYKIAAAEDVYPGSFEKYIASIITEWKRKRKHFKKFSDLKKQLQFLGLTTGIDTSKVNDTRVEIRVSRNKSEDSDYINIADVGFGVSQTLPVLVALLCARKGQLVYIEQPELHLHPGAQFKLARIIAESVNRGVKVVIETHSSMLLRGIQIEVVKQRLGFEKVSLNWFTQSSLNGETVISTAKLDKYGAFGDWPEDFDDVTLKAEQIYLDAIEEALSGDQIS